MWTETMFPLSATSPQTVEVTAKIGKRIFLSIRVLSFTILFNSATAVMTSMESYCRDLVLDCPWSPYFLSPPQEDICSATCEDTSFLGVASCKQWRHATGLVLRAYSKLHPPAVLSSGKPAICTWSIGLITGPGSILQEGNLCSQLQGHLTWTFPKQDLSLWESRQLMVMGRKQGFGSVDHGHIRWWTGRPSIAGRRSVPAHQTNQDWGVALRMAWLASIISTMVDWPGTRSVSSSDPGINLRKIGNSAFALVRKTNLGKNHKMITNWRI